MADKPGAFETRAHVGPGGAVRAAFEVRDDPTTGAPTLHGYAAMFDEPYDMGPFRERIDPTAFNRTLGSNADVRLLVDHEGQPLARTKSGTLALHSDERGLRVQATLDPSDPDVQRLLPKMRRGDLDQMSFAFRVPAGGDEWTDNYSLRTLRQVELNGGDVSVVTYPANKTTEASIRAADPHEAACVFVEAIVHELRAGKAISSDNMDRLKRVLDALAAADDNLDAAEAAVAEILGVPDPDNDAADEQAVGDMSGDMNSRSLSLALATATRLSIR